MLRFHRAAGVALGLACAACGGPEEPPRPPNLLLVTIDTLRADRLACYGGDAGVGAGICGLADRGIRFRWAFSAAPYTAPSVASVLTSQYPGYHGVTQSSISYLRNETVTVAEELRDAGYMTAAFVSNPVLSRSRNLGQGFEVYDQQMPRRERNRPGFHERAGESTTDAALAWAQVAAEPPWFLWVHYQDPHGPYEPPDAEPEVDADDEVRLPVLPNHSGRGGIPAYQELPGLFTPGAYERRYIDEIRYLDPHVKRLVQRLDALGTPPAVLLTSDHGEAFGEDGYYFAHGHSVSLDQIRVPLLCRLPQPIDPRVVDRPVSLIDVAPTLLQLAGVRVPKSFQGLPLPLAPDAAGSDGDERPIFAEHGIRAAVVEGSRYYARDRERVDEGVFDPTSGAHLYGIPARTATLGGDGPLPPYAISGSDPPATLEEHLSGFLDSTVFRPRGRHEEVPEDQREALDALGYLE